MIQYSAMLYYNWDTVEEEALNQWIGRQMIHGETMTVARIRLKKGAVVPMHQHPNEQVSMVESGSLRFSLAGEERTMHAGDVLVIPPDVPHRVEALEDSLAIDLFSPPREDWMRGDDSYLRHAVNG